MDRVFLRKNEKNIGSLYFESLENSEYNFDAVKSLSIINWNGKLSTLLDLISKKKIYLRHIPIFKEEEHSLTHGRFLMALVGLENTLDLMNIHVSHDEKHSKAIDEAKNKLNKLKSKSTGAEKKIYKSFLNQLEKNVNFESRIFASLNENKDYISNFFTLSALGDNAKIAKDLSAIRNDLAHGNLNNDLDLKSDYQMSFLMLYILYLQLTIIGFTKKEASEIVPQILFTH